MKTKNRERFRRLDRESEGATQLIRILKLRAHSHICGLTGNAARFIFHFVLSRFALEIPVWKRDAL
jgi:hypothetical protein